MFISNNVWPIVYRLTLYLVVYTLLSSQRLISILLSVCSHPSSLLSQKHIPGLKSLPGSPAAKAFYFFKTDFHTPARTGCHSDKPPRSIHTHFHLHEYSTVALTHTHEWVQEAGLASVEQSWLFGVSEHRSRSVLSTHTQSAGFPSAQKKSFSLQALTGSMWFVMHIIILLNIT